MVPKMRTGGAKLHVLRDDDFNHDSGSQQT